MQLPTGRPRRRNPRGQGGRLREEIIEAAVALLERTGSEEALSLRGVAREVGVAAPSLYAHFQDKDSLLRAALARLFSELHEEIVRAQSAHGDPAARLRAGCLAYCRFGLERPGPYRALFARRWVRGPGIEDPPGGETFALLVDSIQDGVDAGVAAAPDVYLAAVVVWAAMHGIVTLRVSAEEFPWPSVEELLDAVLAGQIGLAAVTHRKANTRRAGGAPGGDRITGQVP